MSTSPVARLCAALLLLLLPCTLRAQEPAPAVSAEAIIAPAPARSLDVELSPLTSDRLFQSSEVGWQVVHVSSGEEVFSYQADEALVPASTMKVLTSATALHHLGPHYRFTTDLYTDGTLDPSGALQGNLYVKGHGDPALVVERLWKLVYDLRIEGVQRITGDVVFDESFLETDYALPGWDKQEDLERGPSYFPPMGALSLNFNTVALVVGPGAEVGGAGRALLETPADSYVTVDNQVKTGAAGSRRWTSIEREVTGSTLKFTVRGSIPVGSGVRKYYRTVSDPTAHFMAAWEQMEQTVGIEVRGQHKRGEVPDGADLLVQHRSPPLAAILMDMNKYSNNFMAEQILRTVGAEVMEAPGGTAKGLAVIQSYLGSLGIPAEEIQLVNGSGLSREFALRPSHLTAVLVDMAADEQVGHEFRASLSIAGQDGTLWRRLKDHPGRLRGKTGTLDGVHCLAGYVEGADGELYAFAFLVNDIHGSVYKAKQLHDRFARRMFELRSGALDATAGRGD